MGAKFKSEERALELVKKTRLAICGDAAIAGIKSIRIVGQTAKSLKINGDERVETRETKIAMQLPDRLMKMTKLGQGDGTQGSEAMNLKQNEVVVTGGSVPLLILPRVFLQVKGSMLLERRSPLLYDGDL